MFMLRSTHHLIVDTIKAGDAKLIADQRATIETLRVTKNTLEDNLIEANADLRALRAELAERQVPAVRDTTTGRFTKREG